MFKDGVEENVKCKGNKDKIGVLRRGNLHHRIVIIGIIRSSQNRK